MACTVRDKTVQVRWTNKSSSRAIISSSIDINQSMIESLEDALSYGNFTLAIVLFVHKL
jgi:hypothetical protein